MSTEVWIYGTAVGLAGWAVWRYARQYHKFLEDGWNRSTESRRQIEEILQSRISASESPKEDESLSSRPGSQQRLHNGLGSAANEAAASPGTTNV